MKISDVSMLMSETGLSPEALGERVGVSGMTIRRWMKLPPETPLQRLYDLAFRQIVLNLVSTNALSSDSPVAREVLDNADLTFFTAALRDLGFDREIREGLSTIEVLRTIGAKDRAKLAVTNGDGALDQVDDSPEWQTRIAMLKRAVQDPALSTEDRAIAYGALFYLIAPVDLIPNRVPAVGRLDDFAVLVLASAHLENTYDMDRGQQLLPRSVS